MTTKEQKSLPQSIIVIGRRWFQKSAGNTYHSAQIMIDGKTVHRTGRTYGYGNQYMQTAAEWLYRNMVLPEPPRHGNGSREPLWRICEALGVTLEYWAEDVSRKADL